MFGIENYQLFLISGIILNITPGADTMYIVTRSVAQGKNVGIISVLGVSTGVLIHTMLVAFGLSAILAASQAVFNIIKFAGALYIVYLGISIFLNCKAATGSPDEQYRNADLPTVYCQAILNDLLNPKVALFFLSFLPQFINPSQAHNPVPFLILGGTVLATGTIWRLILAFAASYFTIALRKNSKISRVLKILSGIIFIGLGLNLAFRH